MTELTNFSDHTPITVSNKTVAMTDEKYEAMQTEIERLTAENERLRAALRNCADLLVIGDEVGNPNETEREAYAEAQALLNQQTTQQKE